VLIHRAVDDGPQDRSRGPPEPARPRGGPGRVVGVSHCPLLRVAPSAVRGPPGPCAAARMPPPGPSGGFARSTAAHAAAGRVPRRGALGRSRPMSARTSAVSARSSS